MTHRPSELTATASEETRETADDSTCLPRDPALPLLGEIISIRPHVPTEEGDALRDSAARLRALLSSLDDLVFELDGKGIYLAIWTTNETLLIAPPNELLGRSVRDALGDEIGRRVTRAVRRALETGRPALVDYCLEVPAGTRWFQGRLAPITGSASPSVCLLVRDITEQKAAESARDEAERLLRHLATHDVLTDLPNRAFFRDRFDHALKKARRRHEELVVLVLDVDRFKDINDTFGHMAGDEVLREVAQRLAGVTRNGDSIARLGGDEFAILLPCSASADAMKVAARVTECLEEPVVIGVGSIKVDVSTGQAIFPGQGTDAETLFRQADAAMYVVKRERNAARTAP